MGFGPWLCPWSGFHFLAQPLLSCVTFVSSFIARRRLSHRETAPDSSAHSGTARVTRDRVGEVLHGARHKPVLNLQFLEFFSLNYDFQTLLLRLTGSGSQAHLETPPEYFTRLERGHGSPWLYLHRFRTSEQCGARTFSG